MSSGGLTQLFAMSNQNNQMVRTVSYEYHAYDFRLK